MIPARRESRPDCSMNTLRALISLPFSPAAELRWAQPSRIRSAHGQRRPHAGVRRIWRPTALHSSPRI